MPKASSKQVNYLNILASQDYDILSEKSQVIIKRALEQSGSQTLSDLSRLDASALINLFSGASKYESFHADIRK